MLYTVMPLEVVLHDSSQLPAQESMYLGRQVICATDESGCSRIVRLLSTNPQDFLDPRFYPGTAIQK